MARKYSKAASKSVKTAMERRKKGTLKSGKGGTRKKPQTGDRHRALGGPQERQESPPKKEEIVFNAAIERCSAPNPSNFYSFPAPIAQRRIDPCLRVLPGAADTHSLVAFKITLSSALKRASQIPLHEL